MKAPNCKCDYCGKDIYKRPDQIRKYKTRFCNNTCASRSRKVRETRECSACGKKVTRKPSEFESDNVFCSQDCYLPYLRNLQEKRHKNLRKEYTCFYCEKSFERLPSQVKGKKYLYCGMPCKDKHNGELFSRENHHRWNPDLTDKERESRRKNQAYINWRESVYRRDNYTCQCCGDDRGGNLIAHHILNFSEYGDLRYEVGNGKTLCEVCHKTFHDNYGYTGNNKKQLIDFIQRYANQLPIKPVTV